MITKFINAHFAHSHSPTKEQRLCFFAQGNTVGRPTNNNESDGENGLERKNFTPDLPPLPRETIEDIRNQLKDALNEKTYGAFEAEQKISQTLHGIHENLKHTFSALPEDLLWAWNEQESAEFNAQKIAEAEMSFYKVLLDQAVDGVQNTTIVKQIENQIRSYETVYDQLKAAFNDTTDEKIQSALKAQMHAYEKLIRSLNKRATKMKSQTTDEQVSYLTQLLRDKQPRKEAYVSLIDEFFANNRDTIEAKIRASDVAEYAENPEAFVAQSINTLRAQFKQDIAGIGKYRELPKEKPTISLPIDENFAQTYEKYTRASMPFSTEAEIQTVLRRGKPAAFCFGNEIHINIDDPQTRAATSRARIIAHELTHFELDREGATSAGLRKIAMVFAKLPQWNDMKVAIDQIWNNRDVTTGARIAAFETDADYLHEILAIAAAHRKAPYTDSNDLALKNLAELFEEVINHRDQQTIFLKSIVDRIEKNVSDNFEEFDILVRDAVTQKEDAEKFLQSAWTKKVLTNEPNDIRESARAEVDAILREDDAKKVRTMNPGGDDHKDSNDQPEPENDANSDDDVKPKDLSKNAKKTLEKVQELTKLLPTMQLSGFSEDAYHEAHDQGVHVHSGADIDAMHQEGMKVAEAYLSEAAADVLRVQRIAENANNWNNLPIETKAQLAEEWNFENAHRYRTLANNGGQPASDIVKEDNASKEQLQYLINRADKHLKTLDIPLQTIEEYSDIKQRRTNSLEKYGQNKSFKSKLFGYLGVNGGAEWLCYYDIVKIFKIYQEAIVESYKAQQNVVTNKIARDTAVFLDKIPYGKPIRQIINRQARSADSEETDKYKTYLEQEGFTYKDFFVYEPTLLSQNRNNVNRVRAILQYAAHHAWLYDLDRYNPHNVYGIDYARIFTQQAFKELVQENEHGKKEEENRGYEKVNKHPDIPPMIQDMRDELKKLNIFAIKGILKRIQEKGKLTHSNVWGMVTLINEMRRNPLLLRVLDKGLLDDIGNIGIGESAWSLTQFKTQRNDFMEWKKKAADTGNIDRSFKDNECYLFKTILRIEKKLSQFPAITGARDKDDAISIILSGKTYEQDGKYISIFQDDPVFNEHRKKWLDLANTTTSAAKTDDDFFGKDGSDVLLAGPGIIEELGTRDSTGRATHQRKFPNFMSAVFKRYDELGKFDPVAQENFRREMHMKLENWFKTRICSNAASATQFPKEIDADNKNMLMQLLTRKLIYREQIIGALENNIKNDNKAFYAEIEKFKAA